ncbi:MAG: PilX N-terminal domain-containing pilus assembly protein [Pseudomonadota bacterium]
MRQFASKHNQRGVTLFVGLIMLVLITLMVTSAFTLSTTNLKSVGNMQAKDEAVAAANKAIEQVLSSPFTTAPTAEQINVDINNDGTADYLVAIATPVCIRASIESAAVKSSGSLPSMSTFNSYNTIWDIEATVNDAKTGTKTTVRSGVRILLTQAQKDVVCT